MRLRSMALRAATVFLVGGAAAPALADDWLTDPVTGCEIWSADAIGEGYGASWAGACVDGKIAGFGVLTFWDSDGLLGRYTGEMAAGKPHGEGSIRMRNAEGTGFDRFDGLFEDGETQGEGLFRGADGTLFFGEVIDGIRHARGTLRLKDGTVLRGEIKDGAGVGPVLVYAEPSDGEVFFGYYEDGARNGFGIHAMANGDIYRGDFANGEPAGPGLIETGDGRQYMGMFAAGLPDGPGTGIDAEGNVLQGTFKDGMPEGMILKTAPDGAQTIEQWKDGERVE